MCTSDTQKNQEGRCGVNTSPTRGRLISIPRVNLFFSNYFLVGFCCQLKKQPHSIKHEKMQILGLGKRFGQSEKQHFI